jgi:hypothetical protein
VSKLWKRIRTRLLLSFSCGGLSCKIRGQFTILVLVKVLCVIFLPCTTTSGAFRRLPVKKINPLFYTHTTWQTTGPLGPSSTIGCDESTLSCQTNQLIRVFGSHHPVINVMRLGPLTLAEHMTFVYILFNEGLAKAYVKQLEDNTQYLQTQIWGRSCPNLCPKQTSKNYI